MDINLATIIKAALILAFVLPMFTLVSQTLPQSPSYLGGPNASVTANLTTQMNSTGLIIDRFFNKTVNGLNKTLLGNSTSGLNVNPITSTLNSFAFIVQGFGVVMADIVELPYLDELSMNFLVTGMQFALPPYLVGIAKIGIGLLDAYLIFSLVLLGVNMIEKYNSKTG